MEIERFSTGRVRPKRASRGVRRYFGGGWSDNALPVNVFLVHHPLGSVSSTPGRRLAARREPPLALHPFLRLARFGLGAEDEIGAGFAEQDRSGRGALGRASHLHTDHVGGVGSLEGRGDRLRTRVGARRGSQGGCAVRPPVPLAEPELVDLAGPPVGPRRSYDVAGDGSLVVCARPYVRARVAGRPGTVGAEGVSRRHRVRGELPAEVAASGAARVFGCCSPTTTTFDHGHVAAALQMPARQGGLRAVAGGAGAGLG